MLFRQVEEMLSVSLAGHMPIINHLLAASFFVR